MARLLLALGIVSVGVVCVYVLLAPMFNTIAEGLQILNGVL